MRLRPEIQNAGGFTAEIAKIAERWRVMGSVVNSDELLRKQAEEDDDNDCSL
jgi:hypothetical protein